MLFFFHKKELEIFLFEFQLLCEVKKTFQEICMTSFVYEDPFSDFFCAGCEPAEFPS